MECFCTDSNHRIWQNNTGQLCTVKNIGFNGLQAIVQGNIFQSAPLKGTGSNRYDRIRNVNAHKARALPEQSFRDFGDAFLKSNFTQIAAIHKICAAGVGFR